MKTRELISYSRKKIKGRRREVFLICTPPLFAEIFFRLAEISVYSILLYYGAFTPSGLFTGESTEQLIITLVFTLVRWFVCAPLYCASAVRLMEFTEEREKRTLFTDMLLDWRFIRRSMSSFIMKKLISAAMLVPAVISGLYTVRLLSSDAGNTELFIAANVCVLCIVSVIAWIAAKVSMMSVPFLLAEFPEKSGAGVVFMSFRFMSGRKKMFVGIGAVFFIPVLTVIAVPFVIPEIISAYTAGISIFFKEDEYSRAECTGRRKKHIFVRKIRQEGET